VSTGAGYPGPRAEHGAPRAACAVTSVWGEVDGSAGARQVGNVVKVVERGRFRVCVYAEEGQRRHAPHCHVDWRDGDAVVEHDHLTVVAGDPLPKGARELLWEYKTGIETIWTMPNPGRPIA
jgi:hypothetical protein